MLQITAALVALLREAAETDRDVYPARPGHVGAQPRRPVERGGRRPEALTAAQEAPRTVTTWPVPTTTYSDRRLRKRTIS
jgi:hypothetical protein